MMPPLLFFQWCCNCTCWRHHPFAAHYTVVPVLLPLPVIAIAIPPVDCHLFSLLQSLSLFFHLFAIALVACDTAAAWLSAPFPCAVVLLTFHCCCCLWLSAPLLLVAGWLLLLSCGRSKPLQMLQPPPTFAVVIFAARCTTVFEGLFLLPSLSLLVDTSSFFSFAAAVALSCLCGNLCFLAGPFFFLLYPYSDVHAFSAVTRNHCRLIVTLNVCHCSCCALVAVAIAVAVLLQLQCSLCPA